MEKIKSLIKNKVFLVSASGVVILALILASVLLFGDKKPPNTLKITSSNTSSTPLVLEDGAPDSSASEESGISSGEKEAVVDVTGELGSQPSNSSNKAKEPAKPVTPVTPSNNEDIQISSEEKEKPYQCGSPNHKCKNAEAHAYLLNLELEGCPTCGSHSCPSFYGTDEWGNTGLFPELCPKYDEKKDPLKYCQDCGKKPGDGRNGTCAQFVQAANCQNCGEFVKANTCHTCK